MRSFLAAPLIGALLLSNACGPAPAPPPAAPPAPTESAAAPPPPAPPPARVTAGAMPEGAQLYAEVTGVQGLLTAARAAAGSEAVAQAYAGIAGEMGVDVGMVERVLGALESVHLGGGRAGGDMKLAMSMVFTDAQPVRELLSRGALVEGEAMGPYGRRLRERGAKDSKDDLVWFEGPRLLVMGDDPVVQGIAAVVEGRAPALSDAQRRPASLPAGDHRVAAFIAPALLDKIVDGAVSFPAPIAIAYDLWEGGLRGAYRAEIAARGVRGNIPLPAPRALAIARRLPVETAGYVALSTGLPGGRQGAAILLAQILTGGGEEASGAINEIDAALAATGLKLADLLGALGGEGVLAGVVRSGLKTKAEIEHGHAVVLVQELADAKPAERVLKLAREALSSKRANGKAKVRAEPGGFSVDLKGAPYPFARVKIDGGRLFAGLGPRDLVDRAAAAVTTGKGTLGDEAAHARALTGLPKEAQVRLWLDLGRVAEMAGAVASPDERAALKAWEGIARGPTRATSGLSFTVVPEDERVRLEIDEINGVGVFAALGIYGVRRYLANAKTAEAKNTVSAIARGAVMAYEREQIGPGNAPVHALCKSAQPVPRAVPRGAKYPPSPQPGADWDTGDATSGWRCLKFTMSQPQYYRYTYTVGGPYKGPARGGPDPGPNGFEVAAEGDLDGNGVTSLFTRIGVVDPQAGTIKLAPEVFVDKEME